MRILYVALEYDYGNPADGHSFEHWNFFHALASMGFEILYFDFMGLMQERGRDAMNRLLEDVARSERPDVLFTVLFQEQLEKAVMRRISDELETVTINWFCDDHWRFENFSRFWAPCFDHVVTTAESALPRYADIGYEGAIHAQWAANHFLYRPLDDAAHRHDLTFVGRPHGDRVDVIRALRRAGLDVRVWGAGWPADLGAGRLTQEEMIRVFNESRINLNLSKSSSTGAGTTGPGARLRAAARRLLRRDRSRGPRTPSALPDQIKGRNFEVPGCGGLLLSGPAEHIERYYEPGREIVVYENPAEIPALARDLLADESRRASIAAAGYERTIREHTYAHRFHAVFTAAGLSPPPLERLLAGGGDPDAVEHVRFPRA